MPWQMEVLIETPATRRGDLPRQDWRAVRPSHGPAYQYATRAEAVAVLQMCYPDSDPGTVRVREVPEP